MGLIIILPFGALACFGIISVYRLVRRDGAGPGQWRTFYIHAVAGIAIGIWLGCFLNYRVANKRLAGFPIPVTISSLDDGRWTTNVPPAFVHYPAILTDILCGIAIALLPIAVAAFLKQVRDRRDSGPTNDPAPPPQ